MVGAGAVGGYVAARLAESGLDVTVLARPGSADRLRSAGLDLSDGTSSRNVKLAVATASELTAPFDVVILAVKADALAAALDDAAPAVGDTTVVIPFLNGIGHIAPLVARFGRAAAGGVLRVATDRRADGTIVVLAPVFEAEIGELDGSASERMQAVAGLLRDAGATVTVSADIVGRMWAKWVFIASIGALTSLMRGSVGDIAAFPAGRGLAAGRPAEVEPVLGDFVARGHQLGLSLPLTGLATLALRVHNGRLRTQAADRA